MLESFFVFQSVSKMVCEVRGGGRLIKVLFLTFVCL